MKLHVEVFAGPRGWTQVFIVYCDSIKILKNMIINTYDKNIDIMKFNIIKIVI